MPGRNEEYDTQLKIIRGSQRTGYQNSPEFTRLDTALGRLNEAMTRLSRPGFQMTGASIAELRALYTEAAIAADKYIEHLPTWVPDRWRSDEGIRRQVGVYNLRELITQDMEALDHYRTNNPMGLEDFLRDARHQVFEEPEEPLRHVGSVMSDRSVIETNGMKGVFTENLNVMNPRDILGFAATREWAWAPQNDELRPYLEELIRLNRVDSTLGSLRQTLGSDEYEKVMNGLGVNNLSMYQASDESKRRMRQVSEKLRRAGCPYKLILSNEDWQTATQDDVNFTLALSNVMKKANNIYSANGVLKNALHVETDSSIGDRNTAMSIVSDLIYKPDLLARSSDMKMKLRNGQTVRGCYMEWAPGCAIADLPDAITGGPEEKKNARVNFDTPEIVKEAGDMLALDYICGNIDRHMFNFHIGLEKGKDGIYRVTKLKGIDNDQSFPVVGPEELKKLKDHYTHIRNVEDFACMKRSTADSILALTKDKLTFALRHKLTEKEINAAWERTKFLQDHIREGMRHHWKKEDEIQAGKIHVIDDDSKAWDRLSLSKVAKVAPPNSIYDQIHRQFVNRGIPALRRSREGAVRALERPALQQRYQELVNKNDPAVQNDPDWVDEQLANKAASNDMQIENMEAEAKYIDSDDMLPMLPSASQMNLSFKRVGDSTAPILQQDQMYQVYHSRRNLSGQTMEYANRALRTLENEQMGDFFAPGYEDHNVVKAAGMKNPNDRYFIDGEPAERYARRKYWSREINDRYESLQDPEDKKEFMRNFVAAHILGAMTSGRHHVDTVCLTTGDNGKIRVQTYEVNLNLGEADINGRQKRIDDLAKSTGGREKRQNNIRNAVREKLTQKVDEGALNNYRNNVRAWREAQNVQNAQNAQNAAVQGNPNRVEPVAFEALNVQRPRRNTVHRNENPALQIQKENQQAGLQENQEAKSAQSRRRGK